MKHLNKLFVAVMMVVGVSSQAQDSNNPWAISLGVNAVDTRASATSGKNRFDKYFSQPFDVKDNWNVLPSVSYLTVSRYVGDNFSFGLTGSVNKIKKYVNADPSANNGVSVTNPGNLMYYGIDGAVKYSFMNLIKSKVIDPNLHLGGGYTFFGDNSFGTVNAGAGITFWFTETIGLALETTGKKSFGDRNIGSTIAPDSPSHMQHMIGVTYKFGGKDTDKDGIYDKFDACPEVAGLKQFNGCPDTDGDGIIDGNDACPDVAGLAALNGCPDTDGDGIADKDDACPDAAGLAALNGCPDTDGDGVADKADKCPAMKGPKENAGCPWPDTDGDSVLDKDDKCPDVAGTVANNGCPEVTVEALDNLKIQARSVYFNTGKSTFKAGDVPVRLDAITAILNEYPTAKFSVEGHTDDTGSETFNLKLSQDRADAVKKALIERGIKAENLTAKGFGSSVPVATNKTKAGRAENRRVELKLAK